MAIDDAAEMTPDALGQGGDLRSRRRLQTMLEVHRTAIELFVQHGYAATTVGEIAHRAGISERTFFRYFPVKEDLITFAYGPPDSGDDLTFSGGLGEALEVVESFFHRRFDLIGKSPDAFAGIQVLIAREPTLIGIVHARIDEDFETLRTALTAVLGPDRDLEVRLLLRAAFGTVKTAIDSWLATSGADDDLPQRYREASAALRHIAAVMARS